MSQKFTGFCIIDRRFTEDLKWGKKMQKNVDLSHICKEVVNHIKNI